MHHKDIIETIKKRRILLQTNQETLSLLSGVSLRTVKQFESGKGNPTLQTLQKIADLLGLELTLKLKNISTMWTGTQNHSLNFSLESGVVTSNRIDLNQDNIFVTKTTVNNYY